MYLTYAEYQNMGGMLEETAFNDIEFEAETYVDWVTFNRLHKDAEYPETLKKCMYHIIQLIVTKMEAMAVPTASGNSGNSITAGIASQSNDGVSVSYNVISAKDMIQTSEAEIQKCIHRYLQGVTNSLGHKLLYRGLYPNE